jgi:hypothetical protein
MSKGKSQDKKSKAKRMTASQVVFVVISVIIVLSFTLSLLR